MKRIKQIHKISVPKPFSPPKKVLFKLEASFSRPFSHHLPFFWVTCPPSQCSLTALLHEFPSFSLPPGNLSRVQCPNKRAANSNQEYWRPNKTNLNQYLQAQTNWINCVRPIIYMKLIIYGTSLHAKPKTQSPNLIRY